MNTWWPSTKMGRLVHGDSMIACERKATCCHLEERNDLRVARIPASEFPRERSDARMQNSNVGCYLKAKSDPKGGKQSLCNYHRI